MPRLVTQRELRSAHSLKFCYLCGEDFEDHPANVVDDDHVPPTGVFLTEDRDAPLILKTHKICNYRHHLADYQVAQLIRLLHDKPSTLKVYRAIPLPEYNIRSQDKVTDIDLKGIIWRWVRGFHAALYREHLPEETLRAIHPPLAEGAKIGNQLVPSERFPQHLEFVRLIKRNRIADRLDSIVCRNGKCIYECFWSKLSDGSWACCFGLQIYDWKELLDRSSFLKRGCVGLYRPESGLPAEGSVGTDVEMPILNIDPLDAFGA